MKIEVSNGEIVDKMTILRIKQSRATNAQTRRGVMTEIAAIEQDYKIVSDVLAEKNSAGLVEQMQLVNESLWIVEDRIREKESKKEFDAEFIELARSVYKQNDRRAEIKKAINILTASKIVEYKILPEYGNGTHPAV